MKESEGGAEIKAHWTQVQLETKGQVEVLPHASDSSWHRAQNFTRSRFGLLGGEGCHLPYEISIVGPKVKGYWGERAQESGREGAPVRAAEKDALGQTGLCLEVRPNEQVCPGSV